MKKLIISLITYTLLNNVSAATTNTNMQVNANIENTCTAFANMIDFGTIQFSHVGSPITTITNFTIQCTKDTAYSVSFDSGLYPSSENQRRLKHATKNEYLQYTLKMGASGFPAQDGVNNGAIIIPNQTSYSSVGRGFLIAEGILVTGEISPNQDVVGGNYSDTVTLTVSY